MHVANVDTGQSQRAEKKTQGKSGSEETAEREFEGAEGEQTLLPWKPQKTAPCTAVSVVNVCPVI